MSRIHDDIIVRAATIRDNVMRGDAHPHSDYIMELADMVASLAVDLAEQERVLQDQVSINA